MRLTIMNERTPTTAIPNTGNPLLSANKTEATMRSLETDREYEESGPFGLLNSHVVKIPARTAIDVKVTSSVR